MGKYEWRKVNISRQTLFWLLCFSAGLLLVLWKCPYGFGGSDEGFYLTVSHRLCLGDSLFADEWHLSQLTSFFLYPFVRLYRMLHGSNEGILLAARHLYVLMHTLVSLMIYLRLRRYGPMAGAASVLFLLFAPFNMMTCSYNTIALDMLALSGGLLGSGEAGNRISWLVGGAAYACAVVCCPYLAVGYVLYISAVLVFRMRRLKRFGGFDFFTGFALRCGVFPAPHGTFPNSAEFARYPRRSGASELFPVVSREALCVLHCYSASADPDPLGAVCPFLAGLCAGQRENVSQGAASYRSGAVHIAVLRPVCAGFDGKLL